MRWLLLFVSGLFLVTSENETIVWSATKRLSWANFKGRPVQNSDAVAVTASGIAYEISTVNNGKQVYYDMKVFAYFSPQNSWYKPKYVNQNVLEHEQLHFDITALYAEIFKQRLKNMKFGNDTQKTKALIKELYHQTVEEMDSVQKLYDKQTEYSVNGSAQMAWRLKITSRLKKYLGNAGS